MPTQNRAWQRMLSGRRLDLLQPSPLDIEIEDIAHGLSRLSRWNGQTSGPFPYTVAQHCLLVEIIFTYLNPALHKKYQLYALLHDGAEYVIGDMISPFKSALGGNYKEIEHALEQAIAIRFSLPPLVPVKIQQKLKQADRLAAWFEATAFAGFSVSEANKLWLSPSTDLKGELQKNAQEIIAAPFPSDKAKELFLKRFLLLKDF